MGSFLKKPGSPLLKTYKPPYMPVQGVNSRVMSEMAFRIHQLANPAYRKEPGINNPFHMQEHTCQVIQPPDIAWPASSDAN